jgi:hypothetical protein
VKDDAFVRAAGVRRFFVVKSFEHVSRFLAAWRRTSDRRSTHHAYDFSTMYTSIPHRDLKECLRRVIREAFLHVGDNRFRGLDVRHLHIAKAHGVVDWCRRTARVKVGVSSRGSWCFSFDDVCTLLDFLVDNTYLKNGIPLSTGDRYSDGDELCAFCCEFVLILL